MQASILHTPRSALAGKVGVARTHQRALRLAPCSATATDSTLQVGTCSVQGTVRLQNEDRFDISVSSDQPADGSPYGYAAVFDGHGGAATAEWLEERFPRYLEKFWDADKPEQSLREAFLAADTKLLQPKRGFMGMMGERGVGGSKCGATGAVVVLFAKGNTRYMATANCGDARILLAQDGKALQLTEDHVPDNEDERKRIEKYNPNPKMELVRYVGGTWRVGGLLALSRAFGDAYMKGPLQFEGINSGSDNYASGFGVVAEPYTTLTEIDSNCTHVIVCSDGLFANEERGGGSGLSNQELIDTVVKSDRTALSRLASNLCSRAQDAGSTDDVTGVILAL